FPIYILISFMTCCLFIRIIMTSLIFEPFMISFVNLIMFFTIENPDLNHIKELNFAKDQAEKANKAKTEFLSSMSHEIRTPLNAIVGFSECMIEAKDLNETKGFAQDIVDASHNLLDIVNGILDISKIEANKMEVIPKEYNPREVFNSLSKLVKPRIGEKPIEFKTYMSPDLPGVLKGDMAKVKQVVLNLLTNAAKYTNKGEIIFNVNCVNRTDTNTCLLYISVKDTGRGIKKEDMEKLFQKFERLDEDKNTTVEGTGLGLAITKSLTEMMGGRINVFSKYGEGSTFRVYLEQDIISMDIPKSNSEEIEINYKAHAGKRILVVDDSKINLKVANQILKPYNFNVVLAESGFEALELAETQTFDLVLMDIMMPKMNGVETLRRLKEIDGFDVPVIALTADAIEGQDEKYIQSGFDDYLSKPIDRYLLDKVLNKFLGGK
ncbi:MAG: response regulator, partial [Bacilli bacterium]|nr:response regulator [Bacilli bacterium]